MESGIVRVTDPAEGPLDGVGLIANGIHTKFGGRGDKRRIVKQNNTEVSIKASVELGVVSISDRSRDIMLSVSIHDMAAVMVEAFAAAKEVQGECQEEISEPAEVVDDR